MKQHPTLATRLAFLLSASCIALVGAPVSAQAVDQAAPDAPAAADAGAPVASDEIVVTGSLIADPNKVSASPIQAVSADRIRATGAVNVESALNQLPQFTPAGGEASGIRATLNLRGLGSQRNLVLLDGRRLPISDISGNIDINILPAAILSGTDIVTGGASAVYGSDALSGVVNFKTIRNIDGVVADVQYGNSFKTDRRTLDASVAFGTKFAEDRGSFLLAVSATGRQPLSGRKRDFYLGILPSSYIYQGTYVASATNLPSQAAVNALFNDKYGITGTVGVNNNFGFNDDGTLFGQTGSANFRGTYDADTISQLGNVRVGSWREKDIISKLNRRTVFSKGSYDLTPGIQLYEQVLITDSTTSTNGGAALAQFAVPSIPVTNPFIPADLRALLASRPNPNAPFTYSVRYSIGDLTNEESFFTSQFLGGVRGSFGVGDWSYDLYASYDSTRHRTTRYNAVLYSRVQTLLNAADGGASLCAGGYNPFGATNNASVSLACKSYMQANPVDTEDLSQTVVQGSVQGSLFKLPAGDVQLAILADTRRNTYKFNPSTSLSSGDIEAVVASSASQGHTSVKEIAVELKVPLLRDVPFFQDLSVDAAARYSDYKPTGGVWAWKADLKWTPVDALLLRGGYQRAVRAPNIGELYAAASGGQVTFGTPPLGGEPCDYRTTGRQSANGSQIANLCVATGVPANIIGNYIFATNATATLTSGNRNLSPEKSSSYYFGAVATPHIAADVLRGFSLSVDYYNIDITNVISVVNGLTALNKCYNLDGSNPSYSASNYYCSLIKRDANGQLVSISTPYLNQGELQTSGVDFQANWPIPLSALGLGANAGRLTLNSAVSYTRSYKVVVLKGSAPSQYVGTQGYPRWRANTTATYEVGPAAVSLNWRYLAGMKDATFVTNPVGASPPVSAYNLFDLTGRVGLTHDITLRAGITNLFNTGPKFVSSASAGTNPALYDIIGRSFYVGARVQF